MGEILKKEGYRIQSVSDGEAALKAAENEKPDLILLDVLMPGMDGYEVCRRIKDNQNLSDIPVIFISILNETKDIVKALKSGGVDYLTKPFNYEEVTARVNTHIKLYKQSSELHELNIILSDSQEQLKNFAAHLQIIREEERTLLAREIHDELGQILVALKIDMGMLKNKVFNDLHTIGSEEIFTKFDNLLGLVDMTIKTTRRIMSGLRPEQLELLGFVDASMQYIHEFEVRYQIKCQFESTISKLKIDPQQSVALFRILQEALSNVTRHAKASVVKVELHSQDSKLRMDIIDNGIGFDKKQTMRSDSYGLLGMKERVFLLGGELNISSKQGEGTKVSIEIPYELCSV